MKTMFNALLKQVTAKGGELVMQIVVDPEDVEKVASDAVRMAGQYVTCVLQSNQTDIYDSEIYREAQANLMVNEARVDDEIRYLHGDAA